MEIRMWKVVNELSTCILRNVIHLHLVSNSMLLCNVQFCVTLHDRSIKWYGIHPLKLVGFPYYSQTFQNMSLCCRTATAIESKSELIMFSNFEQYSHWIWPVSIPIFETINWGHSNNHGPKYSIFVSNSSVMNMLPSRSISTRRSHQKIVAQVNSLSICSRDTWNIW